MASQWTCKNAILRDLSVAQGREVPVEIVNPVTSDEKPPALDYKEETEEEFYEDCVGSGDYNTGPDIHLIKQMLDMVREVDITDNEDLELITEENMLEISKTNAPTLEAGDGLEISHINKSIQKQKKERNVAIASLLAAHGDNLNINSNNEETPNPKLLKPDDFMSNTKSISNETNKNNDSLITNKMPIIQSPTSMFKKKIPNGKNPDVNGIFKKGDTSPSIIENNNSLTERKTGCYVPSSHATERYEAYLQKSKIKEQVMEDVWARAERQMKEIDAKRKLEAPSAVAELPRTQDCINSEATGKDFVNLPQHRHLLPGDCIVCQVLCTDNKDVQQVTGPQD